METVVDDALSTIANYAADYKPTNEEAYTTARACLADTLGCGLLALNFPACTKLLGPLVPGTVVPNGAKVPGTGYILDPVLAAFNFGTMIRWLDYNDTWLAAEWGHPSDNLGAILSVADFLDRNGTKMVVRDILTAMIKAHEIQGGLALNNSFNMIGFDHVILVKVASTAIATKLMGGDQNHILNAISNAWIDTGPLRTYRHAPSTGSRKSWAAGDATSRGVFLATLAMRGEMGYPQALSSPKWGFYDVMLKGKPLFFSQPLKSYVMENILFKISYPAEFHAQTAVECAVQLHEKVRDQWHEIDRIEITTHESAIRIIDKVGPLKNPADRDHCLQYMTAIGLLYGDLTADHYEDESASDPRVDELRSKMVVVEEEQYSLDYLDPDMRSIPNKIKIRMDDGTIYGPIEVKYPIGHRRRRSEGIPLLYKKFEKNLSTQLSEGRVRAICALFQDQEALDNLRVGDFIDLFTQEG